MIGYAKWAVCATTALSLSGCISTENPTAQFTPSTGFSPTLNRSPMDPAIECMSQATGQPGRRPLRLAVGQIKDFTGKFSNEASEGGFKITQGASLMIISALGKLDGIEQVERFDTTVSDQEATLAKAQLIRDPDSANGQVVRPLTAGMYDGSDYFIVGGVTEANYTISSGGAELNISQVGGGSRYYVMNVAADLRLVETKSLHVVKTISVQKQIVGREVETGVFNFLGNYLIDISAGNKTNEPMQMGVRSTLELGTMELLSPLYDNYFDQCMPVAEAAFGGPIKPVKLKPQPTIQPPPLAAPIARANPAPVRQQAVAAPPRAQASPAPTVAAASAAPKLPVIASAPVPNPPDKTASTVKPAGYVAQVGALASTAEVEKLWVKLTKAFPKALDGKARSIVATEVKGTVLYRAEIGGFETAASAKDFCQTLAKADQPCFVRS